MSLSALLSLGRLIVSALLDFRACEEVVSLLAVRTYPPQTAHCLGDHVHPCVLRAHIQTQFLPRGAARQLADGSQPGGKLGRHIFEIPRHQVMRGNEALRVC